MAGYRETIQRTRPRCATCPHYLDPTPPMRLDGPGNCTLGPGQVIAMLQRDPNTGETATIPTTYLPVKHPNGYCGSHPEFMAWWSKIRKAFHDLATDDGLSDLRLPTEEGHA